MERKFLSMDQPILQPLHKIRSFATLSCSLCILVSLCASSCGKIKPNELTAPRVALPIGEAPGPVGNTPNEDGVVIKARSTYLVDARAETLSLFWIPDPLSFCGFRCSTH